VQLLGPIYETERSRGSNCVSVPNFVAIGPIVIEMAIFRLFKMAVAAIMDLEIFENFNGRMAQRGRTASVRQILSKLVKPQPRHGDFSIFQDGSRSRHLGFLKFEIFNGRTAQEG